MPKPTLSMREAHLRQSGHLNPAFTRILVRFVTDIETRTRVWMTLVITLFCFLALGLSGTKRPWCDEGWFASVAFNLMHRGVMGMTVLDPHGFIFAPFVKDIDKYTYWIMPGYAFMQ